MCSLCIFACGLRNLMSYMKKSPSTLTCQAHCDFCSENVQNKFHASHSNRLMPFTLSGLSIMDFAACLVGYQQPELKQSTLLRNKYQLAEKSINFVWPGIDWVRRWKFALTSNQCSSKHSMPCQTAFIHEIAFMRLPKSCLFCNHTASMQSILCPVNVLPTIM